MSQQFDSLMHMMEAFPDEQACIDQLTAIRWKKGAFCPHCGGTNVSNVSDRKTHKCDDCYQRFSIRIGTIFEDTKLPLSKWFMAIWMETSSPKGIASTQFAKDLKITQKSARFVRDGLRHAALIGHMRYRGPSSSHNLHDQMTDLELILTTLSETPSKKVVKQWAVQKFGKNAKAKLKEGAFPGFSRKQTET